MGDLFARRHGYRARRDIRVREGAPAELRYALVALLHEIGLSYARIRDIICPVLHTVPDPNNWSEVPNIRDEVTALIQGCDWFCVYDIFEAAYLSLRREGVGYQDYARGDPTDQFAERANELFEELGIGWQMVGGRIVTRGPEEFEHVVNEAVNAVDAAGYQTPKQELVEARKDLSRRPEPDTTGTVQHCMAALECVARLVSGENNATLGDIIRRRSRDLGIPAPLDRALEQVWGHASQIARHLQEGRRPSREEAELLLNLSAALTTYLLQRNRNPGEGAARNLEPA